MSKVEKIIESILYEGRLSVGDQLQAFKDDTDDIDMDIPVRRGYVIRVVDIRGKEITYELTHPAQPGNEFVADERSLLKYYKIF